LNNLSVSNKQTLASGKNMPVIVLYEAANVGPVILYTFPSPTAADLVSTNILSFITTGPNTAF
jgi:hypothetical protein